MDKNINHRPLKHQWVYGENDCQKYYDVKIGEDYLCVYANNWQPDVWIATMKDLIIWNKTANDRERKKEGLPKGCDVSLLKKSTLLTSDDPEYLKRKVEWCYDHNVFEISS